MERKRLDDLDEALKQADEQIKTFRMSTKKTAVDLLNQHRFTAQPAKARTDGIDPSKLAETSRKKLISSFEHRLNNMRIRLSQTENHNEKLKSQIDSLRRHRMTSNKSREKIEKSIKEIKRLVEGVLERSRGVSEARENVIEQLHELHRQQNEDRDRFSEQMKALAEFIDKQNREFEESMAAAAVSTTRGGGGRGALDAWTHDYRRGKNENRACRGANQADRKRKNFNATYRGEDRPVPDFF